MAKPRTVEVNWGDETNLASVVSRLKVDPKVRATNNIAYWVIAIFGVALFMILLTGMLVIIVKSPTDSAQVITETMDPFLQTAANFVSTMFGPLLAFILGYYFASAKGAT